LDGVEVKDGKRTDSPRMLVRRPSRSVLAPVEALLAAQLLT